MLIFAALKLYFLSFSWYLMRQGKVKILAWHCGDRAQYFFYAFVSWFNMYTKAAQYCRQDHLHSSQGWDIFASRTETLRRKTFGTCKLSAFPRFLSLLHHHNKGIGMSGEKVFTITTPGISGFTTLNSPCQIARLVQRTLSNLNHSQLPVN